MFLKYWFIVAPVAPLTSPISGIKHWFDLVEEKEWIKYRRWELTFEGEIVGFKYLL